MLTESQNSTQAARSKTIVHLTRTKIRARCQQRNTVGLLTQIQQTDRAAIRFFFWRRVRINQLHDIMSVLDERQTTISLPTLQEHPLHPTTLSAYHHGSKVKHHRVWQDVNRAIYFCQPTGYRLPEGAMAHVAAARSSIGQVDPALRLRLSC